MRRWRSLSVSCSDGHRRLSLRIPSRQHSPMQSPFSFTPVSHPCHPRYSLSSFSQLHPGTLLARFGWLFLLAGGTLGIILIKIGTPHRLKFWLYAHIALCLIGVLFLASSWLASRNWLNAGFLQRSLRFAALALLIASVSVGAWWTRPSPGKIPTASTTPPSPLPPWIRKATAPTAIFPQFRPDQRRQLHPSDYFLKSQACERCHSDIYKQWQSSMHHFSSFNNSVVSQKHRVHAGSRRR